MENHHFDWIFPLKIVFFHSYVKLPEGTDFIRTWGLDLTIPGLLSRQNSLTQQAPSFLQWRYDGWSIHVSPLLTLHCDVLLSHAPVIPNTPWSMVDGLNDVHTGFVWEVLSMFTREGIHDDSWLIHVSSKFWRIKMTSNLFKRIIEIL